MKSSALALAICLLVSCDGTEKGLPPVGQRLSDLPTANHSTPLDPDRSNFIEIIVAGEQSELFHRDNQIATTSSPKELFSQIKAIRRTISNTGNSTHFLISAPALTPFKTIKERVRTAASTGIHQIHFLVRSTPSSTLEAVSINLPTADMSPGKIEPYFLQIDAKNRIFSGTGAGRTRMDSDSQDQNLIKLCEQLEHFSAAAKAAGVPNPPCQIYVDPGASYQRFIDLISLTNKYRLNPFVTDMEPEMPKPIKRLIHKPTPPNSNPSKPLGLAPKEE